MPLSSHMPKSKSNGFTLIEVLVSAIILAIGILGVATLTLTGLRSDRSSYLRTQASIIAYDIADRIRINKTAADAGSYDNIDTQGDIPEKPDCMTANLGCSSAQIAALDIHEWANHFENVDSLTQHRPKLPGGAGVVTRSGSRYTVQITWNEVDWADNNNSAPTNKALVQQSLTINFDL